MKDRNRQLDEELKKEIHLKCYYTVQIKDAGQFNDIMESLATAKVYDNFINLEFFDYKDDTDITLDGKQIHVIGLRDNIKNFEKYKGGSLILSIFNPNGKLIDSYEFTNIITHFPTDEYTYSVDDIESDYHNNTMHASIIIQYDEKIKVQ